MPLPLIPSPQDAAAHQKPLGSSSFLSSSLQHQAECLHGFHKTTQQFNENLKAKHFDRQTLQPIVLQLQNEFALLRYLLSPRLRQLPRRILLLETPLPDFYLTLTRTLSLTLLHLPSHIPALTDQNFVVLPRFDLWDHPERKQTILQTPSSTPNTQEAPPTMLQNRTSRIFAVEKLFADEIAAYTSINAGFHSQYFFLYDKIRQLKAGNSDAMIWKIPSVKFFFHCAKLARLSSEPLIEPTTSFTRPIFRTYPHGYKFFIKFYPYGIGAATSKCASIILTLFPGDYENLLQWLFWKIIHIGIRDQLYPLNTWKKTIHPDQHPAYRKPTISTNTGVETITIKNFVPHSKLCSGTECFLIDDASYIQIKISNPPVLKLHTQTSLLLAFP